MASKTILFFAFIGAHQAIAENVIDVFGTRRESQRLRRPGHSEVITPKQDSRFQTTTHLRERSAFDPKSTGQISASGFLLPRTRGQDAKATDIYLDQLRLFDPLTGFPLVEDLDMRAFGRLTIHRGLSPALVTGTNPIGTLVFAPRPPQNARHTLGIAYGRPFGLRSTAITESADDKTKMRMYLRFHETDGRYPFFDDNGTPANSNDDRIRWREDNSTRSWQAAPFVSHRVARHRWRLLGVYGVGERGIPSLGGRRRTGAMTGAHTAITIADYTYKPTTNGFFPDEIGIQTAYRHEERQTRDPAQQILVTAREQTLRVFSYTTGFPIMWDESVWALRVTPESGVTTGATRNVQRQTSVKLKRSHAQVSIGVSFLPDSFWTIEAKSRWRQRSDVGETASANSEGTQPLNSRDKGAGLSIGWDSHSLGFYAQLGREERPPGLFEEFGDGGALLANPDLRPETVGHRELGATVDLSMGPRASFAYFHDRTTDKIVFIPSLANAFKAVNRRETLIRGLETELSGQIIERLTFGIGYSRLWAEDRSSPANITRIPQVPEQILVSTASYSLNSGTLRVGAHHRGRSYTDVLNQDLLPPITTYKTSIDFFVSKVSWSFAVDNLTDVKSASFDVPGTGETGRRAYSDLSGYPLPGRTWLSSLTARL